MSTTIDKNVYVPMRDGVKISVDVYRPSKPGKYPALVAIGSYGKELEAMTKWLPPQPRTGLWDGCIETGDSEYLNSRGYAHVVADSRGAGYSEGVYLFHESDMNDEHYPPQSCPQAWHYFPILSIIPTASYTRSNFSSYISSLN